MSEEFLTTGEAARLLGVRSVNTVKRMIREGRLSATQPGAHYRIRREDLEDLVAADSASKIEPPDPFAIPRAQLASWAQRHGVQTLSVFGSAARGELRPESDIDLVMELKSGTRIGLFEHVGMAGELEVIFGRAVDLGTWNALKPRVQADVEREAVPLFEA
jgi:excisionase family DNA binding protein